MSGRGQWNGSLDGEPWAVEVDMDCFAEAEPYVVTIWTRHEDADGKDETMAGLSAEQAREMAAVLLFAADNVDFNNARMVEWKARDDAPR